MDVTPYLELSTGPKIVFDAAERRRTRPRFMLPSADGRGSASGSDWVAVTWGAYAQQIRGVASFLRAVGLSSTGRACILGHNRVEWMSAAIGIQAAGGVMVPIYPASTVEQAAYVVEHSDAEVLFVDGEDLLGRVLAGWSHYSAVRRVVLMDDALDAAKVLRELRAEGVDDLPDASALNDRLIRWSDAQALGAARAEERPGEIDELVAGLDLDQPALMLYTSGTTGKPKGVPLTHRNVAANGRDWLECNATLLDEGAVDLLWLPMSHIFGFGEAGAGDRLGWVSYLCEPADALRLLPEVKPNVFMSVPAYWEKLAQQAMQEQDPEARRRRLSAITGGALRFCLSGGAGLKREVKELFYASGLLIIEGYGLTECSPTLTLNRPDDFRFDSVGKPLPSVELKLAEDGEILAKGPNVFGGYHHNPQATAEAFSDDGWFKTGDVGRWTDDGFLQIVDRKKEILVTAGGKNVPPANVEMRFADDALFRHVVVYGDGKKFLVAGVWLEPEAVDAALGEREVTGDRGAAIGALIQARIDGANEGLARFEQIKRFQIMDAPLTVSRGLLTSTLKVRRKEVYEAFRDQFEALYER
jgi:long-chain acyl-CoA synthetase